ncbi:MAG: hypothetical protein JSV52_14840 [Candidatus Zixiibacteriota bacterium]|nr:MAG: hypothetical protein JSV52_14840 [candidate division Zixibacteria bacterium]
MRNQAHLLINTVLVVLSAYLLWLSARHMRGEDKHETYDVWRRIALIAVIIATLAVVSLVIWLRSGQ